jgi:hypothetical protein
MAEQIHVLATFESQEAVLEAMKGAASWIKLTDAQALAALALSGRDDPPDPYASRALRPGLSRSGFEEEERQRREHTLGLIGDNDG